MLIPLGVLALGAVFSGMLWYNSFFGDEAKMRDWFGMAPAAHATEGGEHAAAPAEGHAAPATTEATEGHAAPAAEGHAAAVAPQGALFIGPDNHVIHEAHNAPTWVKVSPFIAMLIGFATAWLFYIKNPSLPRRLAAAQPALYQFLLNKWYFDELYNAIFVIPARWLGGFLWKKGDGAVIDGTINGVAMGLIPMVTRFVNRMQSGYIFHYAFAMVLGIAALITWMTLSGGAH